MAVYKVPQDVEAEDKLLGPFSFRQFIYLIIAVMGGLLAYGLGSLFWPLGFIPVPIVAFFLIIALPLRKDQPMETYVTALIQFFLKPRIRLWDPEGELNLVEITAPKVAEGPALKDMSGQEASERLRYLAQVVDTHGWATRGLTSATSNVSLNDNIVAEAQSTEDMFDNNTNLTQQFDTMITQSDHQRKAAMLQSMQNSIQATATGVLPAPTVPATPVVTPPPTVQAPTAQTPPAASAFVIPAQPQPVASPNLSQALPAPAPVAAAPAPAAVAPQPLAPPQTTAVPEFNPYPSSMHQRVILPASEQQALATAPPPAAPATPQVETQAQASSTNQPSPDIMRLATNNDLSISTIAREADRLQKKQDEEEVVVSLR